MRKVSNVINTKISFNALRRTVKSKSGNVWNIFSRKVGNLNDAVAECTEFRPIEINHSHISFVLKEL